MHELNIRSENRATNEIDKNKPILFINQSSGYLMLDIVEAFIKEGYKCSLAAGFVNPRSTVLHDSVTHIKLAEYDRSSTVKRLLTWGFAFIKLLYLVKTRYRKAHLFIVSNPPFAPLLPLFCKNSFDLLIYDVYPDALIEFNVVGNKSRIAKLWRNANKSVFKRARRIFSLTEGMKTRLEQYVDTSLVQVVPVWTDNEYLQPIEKKENIFLKQHGLQEKFIVMYSGNMGKSHPVEVLIQLAEKLKSDTDIYFLLIGGGDKFTKIQKEVGQKQLQNISVLPWQPTEMLPQTLSAADIALVTIGKEASELSIPSKTYNLMSVGTPVLGVAPANSALAELIITTQCGQVFDENDISEMKAFILDMKRHPEKHQQLKQQALKASESYTSENAALFI
jgi:glycosyltransferase involved in cell wall biosynthesis